MKSSEDEQPLLASSAPELEISKECNAQIVDANIEHLSQLLGRLGLGKGRRILCKASAWPRSRRQLYEEHLRHLCLSGVLRG